MFDQLKQRIIAAGLNAEEEHRVDQAVHHLNSAGYDKWGVQPETLKSMLALFQWLYKVYFRVETLGIENLPKGPIILIANHGGQVPLDGMMIALSVLLEADPPRIARGMVERWAPSLPFVSTFFSRCGQVVGDQRNCRDLLENGECVLVFPEGVTGSGKTIDQAYQLQRFGTGFVRLALEAGVPIVPVAVIGSEETYPSLMNVKWLARLLGAPYIPVTPFFPLLGPLGFLPLPTKITLRYGKPIHFKGDPDAPDSDIEKKVGKVKAALEKEIRLGLKKRAGRIFTGSGR